MRGYRPAIILTFGLWVLWGFGHRLYDTLVPEFGRLFDLSETELVLTQSVYSLAYLIISVPAALYARALGAKASMVFGLGCWCVGCFLFYPAAQQQMFLSFLFAASMMGMGYVFLELGANPIIARLGPPETTIRRLNFAHALYPIGVLTALYVGRWTILSDNALPLDKLAGAVVQPYMALGGVVLVAAFLVDKMVFPPSASEREGHRGAWSEFRELLSQPRFLAAMGAQMCNVVARAGTWALSFWYVKEVMPGTPSWAASDYLLAALVVFAIGRLGGAVLMLWFNPIKLLAGFAASGVIFGLIATFDGGHIGAIAIVASSLSVSIMFATILGSAIADLGPKMKTGTALMYTGGAGTAIALSAIHFVWHAASAQLAMVVPTLGFIGVLIYALTYRRAPTPG